LNAATGAQIWSYPTTGEIEDTAAVANGVVYVGSDDGAVYAISAQAPSAGDTVWKYTTSGLIFGSPAVSNNTVFVGSYNGILYALDAHAGTVNWSVSGGAGVRPAAVANGVVYFTSETNTFYAVAATTGAILGTANTGTTIFGSPSISDGVVYLATDGGSIYALSLPPNLNTNALRRAGTPVPSSLRPDPRLRVAP
jgi:outer membrane protein assembly factor BamB